MPDGGIKEDFPHIENTISQLVKSEKIPPIILVGIENTERGRNLTGSSTIEDDEKYCPLTDGAKKGIIGESLAGLFVMKIFFLEPEAFDFYIAIDPSLWWNNNYLERKAKNYLRNFPKKSKKLWFADSSAKDISIHTNNLAKSLEKDAPSKLIWKYSDEPNEKHHTIFRAKKIKL